MQYNPISGTLRIRLVEPSVQQRLAARLPNDKAVLPSRFLTVPCPPFAYLERLAQQGKTTVADLLSQKPITIRLKETAQGFTVFLSVNLVSSISAILGLNTLGIDFNADGLAYNVIKPDGNRLGRTGAIGSMSNNGFLRSTKTDSADRNEHALSNVVSQLMECAIQKNCDFITIENLEFFEAKTPMRTGRKPKGPVYNKMLSMLAYEQFQNMVIRKAERLGFKVNLINPRFSSIAGFVKFAYRTNQSVDIGAAQAIGRQPLRGTPYHKKADAAHVTRFTLKQEVVAEIQPQIPLTAKNTKNTAVLTPSCLGVQSANPTRKNASLPIRMTWSKVFKVLGPKRSDWRQRLKKWKAKACSPSKYSVAI